MQEVTVSEARARFAELVDQVRYRGEGVLLTKSGKAAAALVPAHVYEEWKQQQEKDAALLQEIWAKAPDLGLDERGLAQWVSDLVHEARRAPSATEDVNANHEAGQQNG